MGDREAHEDGLAQTIDEAHLFDATRDRAPLELSGRDRWVTVAGACAFVVAATSLIVTSGATLDVSLPFLALVVVAYAAVSRIEFAVGSGSLVPTQLMLVPMLFVLHPAIAPAAVAAGLLLGSSVDLVRGRLHVSRLLVPVLYSTHALGPALVLVLAGVDEPRWSDWPVLLLALAAQFALDFVSILVREVFALGVQPRVLLDVLPRVYALDALLSPVGLLAAFAARDDAAAMFAVVPLALVFHLAALERRERIDRTVELSGAYAEAHQAARTDGLTGLANRLAWEEALLEITASQAAGPRSVIVLDIDSLKRANDVHGHEVGDQIIREVAATLDHVAGRRARLVARLGGDEFACIVEGAAEAECHKLVVQLRAALAQHPGLPGVALSASVGGASCPPAASLVAAIEEADRRAYEEKTGARPRHASGDEDVSAVA